MESWGSYDERDGIIAVGWWNHGHGWSKGGILMGVVWKVLEAKKKKEVGEEEEGKGWEERNFRWSAMMKKVPNSVMASSE